MIERQIGVVYLIHFETPIHHARHYMGWTNDLDKRLEDHRIGNGSASKLMAEVARLGINWSVVRTWPMTTRLDERRLKARHEGPKFCPICNGTEENLP